MNYAAASAAQPRRHRRSTRALALAGALVLSCGGLFATTAPAYAADAAPTNVALTVSNNATSEGASAEVTSPVTNRATYTWQFTTGAALSSGSTITMSVPNGTTALSGGLTLGDTYGLTGCNATVGALTSGTSTTVSLTLANATSDTCSVAAGTSISIAITGIVNTTTADSGFTTAVSTSSDGTPGTAGTAGSAVPFSQNSTDVTVVVPKSLTFTNATTSLRLLPVPGGDAVKGDVNLTVATNAGYYLSACVPAGDEISNGSYTIDQVDGPATLDGNTTGFGAQATLMTPGNNQAGVVGSGVFVGAWKTTSGSDYVGYASTCDAVSGDSSLIASNVGSTTGDQMTLANAVRVNAAQPADEYHGAIVYQVAPEY